MQSNRLYETFRELTVLYSPTFQEQDFCSLLKKKMKEIDIVCEEDDAG